MKKLKTLCAVISAAAMMITAAPTFAAEQKFKVPEYSLKGAEEKTIYGVITPNGQVIRINNLLEAQGFPVLTSKLYGIDSNNDGKKDIVYMVTAVPDINSVVDGEEQFEKGFKIAQLIIDDNYDGSIERILTDRIGKDKSSGMDGIYDEEEPFVGEIEDLFK